MKIQLKCLRAWRNLSLVMALAGFSVLLAIPAQAQSYQVFPSQFSGGGGSSSSGGYRVRGSVMAMPARKVTTHRYALSGGFWSILGAVNSPSTPVLSIKRSGSSVIISWPVTSSNFQLQVTRRLETGASWSPVGVTPLINKGVVSVTLRLERGNRFFRLAR